MKQFLSSTLYIFINYFVANIPCWHLRKFLYKIFGLKIGKNSRIYMKSILISPWKIEIGENTTINERCVLDGRGGLKIGNNTSISMQSLLLTASHSKKSSTFKYYESSVEIKDNVWLGSRAIVLDGSCIENYCIIAAGSTFKGKSEENTVYMGVPAVKVKNRELENKYVLSYKDYLR